MEINSITTSGGKLGVLFEYKKEQLNNSFTLSFLLKNHFYKPITPFFPSPFLFYGS